MNQNSNKETIVVILGTLLKGGAETFFYRLGPKFSESYNYILFPIIPLFELPTTYSAQYVDRPILESVSSFSQQSRLRRFLYLLSSFYHLFRLFLRIRPKYVFGVLPLSTCYALLVSLLFPKTHYLYFRRSLNTYGRKAIFSTFDLFSFLRSSAIVGNSTAVTNELLYEISNLPYPRSLRRHVARKVSTVHNGISFNSNHKPKSDYKASDCFSIAYVANLIPYKGHDTLINSLFDFELGSFRHLTINLFGRLDRIAYIEHLRTLSSRLPPCITVEFHGSAVISSNLLNNFDLYVHPTYEEGFSNSILEAMSSGLPIIATNVGGNVDQLTHMHTGLLIPPRDPQALAEAISTLMRSEKLRSNLGVSAFQVCSQRFTINQSYLRLQSLLQSS